MVDKRSSHVRSLRNSHIRSPSKLSFFATDTDECKSSPCQNGGTCVDGLYDFTCVCPRLFIGKRCEGSVTSHNFIIGVKEVLMPFEVLKI